MPACSTSFSLASPAFLAMLLPASPTFSEMPAGVSRLPGKAAFLPAGGVRNLTPRRIILPAGFLGTACLRFCCGIRLLPTGSQRMHNSRRRKTDIIQPLHCFEELPPFSLEKIVGILRRNVIASRNFRRSPSRKLSVFFVETFCEPEGAWISADTVTGGKAAATARATAAVTIRLLYCPCCFFINNQLISDPEEMFRFSSGVMRASVPSSSSAQRSMPSERTPASFAGFRLQRTMTFFPTISSGE